MHAERLILSTDEQGRLTQLPALPPNTTVEIIVITDEASHSPDEWHNQPPPSIVGEGKILGDIMSPVVPSEDWDALK